MLEAKQVELAAPWRSQDSNSTRCRRCGWRRRSRALRDQSDQMLKDSEAPGRRSSSPISARLPISPRARPLPRAFSRPAAIEAIDLRKRFFPPDGEVEPGGAGCRLQGVRRGAGLPVLIGQGLCASRQPPRRRPFKPPAPRHIYLAGRPGEQEAALRAAGIGDFIFAGGDALAMLAGSLAADGASMTAAKNRPDRRLPVRRHPLCAVGAAGSRSASAIAGCARRHRARHSPPSPTSSASDFAWTTGQASGVPVLLDRRCATSAPPAARR